MVSCYSFSLSSNSSIASFLQTTRKTVFSLLISTHLSVCIWFFNVSNSVMVSLQSVMSFNNSKCFSPQKSFTSCPVSVLPSIIIKHFLFDILQSETLVIEVYMITKRKIELNKIISLYLYFYEKLISV